MKNKQVIALIIACCATIEIALFNFDTKGIVICLIINLLLFHQSAISPRYVNDDNETDYSPIKISLVTLSLVVNVVSLIVIIFCDNYSTYQTFRPIIIGNMIYYIAFFILYFIYNKNN